MQPLLVILLRSDSRPADPHVRQLRSLFSAPYYRMKVVRTTEPFAKGESKHGRTHHRSNAMFRQILHFAALEGKDAPCLFIRDSSLTNLSAATLQGHIHLALQEMEKETTPTLTMLCKWNDACHQYADKTSSVLKWSPSPTALQAVLFPAQAREIFLRGLEEHSLLAPEEVLARLYQEKKLAALVFSPNIVHYDLDLARRAEDYAKRNECAQVVSGSRAVVETSIWLSVVLVLVMMVLGVLIAIR